MAVGAIEPQFYGQLVKLLVLADLPERDDGRTGRAGADRQMSARGSLVTVDGVLQSQRRPPLLPVHAAAATVAAGAGRRYAAGATRVGYRRCGRLMLSGLGHRSRSSAGQPQEVFCLLPTRLSAIEVFAPSSGMIAHAAR